MTFVANQDNIAIHFRYDDFLNYYLEVDCGKHYYEYWIEDFHVNY